MPLASPNDTNDLAAILRRAADAVEAEGAVAVAIVLISDDRADLGAFSRETSPCELFLRMEMLKQRLLDNVN